VATNRTATIEPLNQHQNVHSIHALTREEAKSWLRVERIPLKSPINHICTTEVATSRTEKKSELHFVSVLHVRVRPSLPHDPLFNNKKEWEGDQRRGRIGNGLPSSIFDLVGQAQIIR